MKQPHIAPYGSWKSPVTTQLIANKTIGLGRIVLDGTDTYWAEIRRSEDGREVIVKRSSDGRNVDVTPDQFGVGSAVHEYGARGYTVAGGVMYFSNFDDRRLYRHQPGRKPVPITPEGDLRYAAMLVDQTRNRVICVREDHTTGEREAVNTIVGIDIDGREEVKVLDSGNDFYASPRLSPDGSALAWLAWNHPDMPWDGTTLWVAKFNDEGMLQAPTFVAGGVPQAIAQPEWSPDGTLYFVSDTSNWWNLYRWREGKVEPVLPMEADFAKTYWWVGMSSFGFESATSIVCSYGRHGVWRLGRVDLESGRLDPLDIPYSAMGHGDLKVAAGRVVFEAGSPVRPMSVLELNLASNELTVLQLSTTANIPPEFLSLPEPIEYPTGNGATAHAFYYPPSNSDYVAPPGEKPPLLVTCHGGPTGAATMDLDLCTQYWTSRGIAVLDVNYGGSTGYGRDYRERLMGEWGVVDVDDSTNGALFLTARGDVDANRLMISGGSAGGFTALAAMTFRDVFKAGASHFGVSDLEALLEDIHKFDTHSLHALVGPYPLYRKKYVERSPINFAEKLSCPVIFFQGLDDTIVPAEQSKAMFEVLRDKGVATAYLTFEGEQHGFQKSETIRRVLEAELYFYSRVFAFETDDQIPAVHIENM
jgi:dipeptidyl aminopeptidase/acylaminoacyl peptidase